jgi:hypothetical protein
MDTLSTPTGYLATALILLAALIPLLHRAFLRRRALPASRPISFHVLLGLAAAAAALLHTFAVLPALGSPAAIRGGMIALAPGTIAFFLLFAHVGVGLRLRDPRLRNRVRIRRWHVVLASSIAVTVIAHITALVLAGAGPS